MTADYAADMTVALTYYKSLDDWKDDRNIIQFLYARCLKKHYGTIREKWPRQCMAIEKEITVLSQIEQGKSSNPDAAANSFGRLMEELFVMKQDEWESPLRTLGFGLGRYIYFADAVLDFGKDKKRGSYNPLNYIETTPEGMRPALEGMLGLASDAFEFLPLVQDAALLRNILYSGIWLKTTAGWKRGERNNMIDDPYVYFLNDGSFVLSLLHIPDAKSDNTVLWLYAAARFAVIFQWHEHNFSQSVEEMALKYERLLRKPLIQDVF